MENLKWRFGARVVAWLHLILMLITLTFVITMASLRLHAQYKEREEMERNINTQISINSPPIISDLFGEHKLEIGTMFKPRSIRSPKNGKPPRQIPIFNKVKPQISGIGWEAGLGKESILETEIDSIQTALNQFSKNPQVKPKIGGISFETGLEAITILESENEASNRTTTIWVLWVFIVLWIIGTGMEILATIFLFKATKPTTETKDSLKKCMIWLIVTIILSILGIVTFALGKAYIVLGIYIVLRASFLVFVFLYFFEVKSRPLSSQNAKVDELIVA